MTHNNVTDLFQTESFTKRVFGMIRSTVHVSLNQRRLHIKVNSTEPLPEGWLKTLTCRFDLPSRSMDGCAKIVKIREMGDCSYQLITEPITTFDGSIVPLPHSAHVQLITRSGDELVVLGAHPKTAS